jgi:hypothetical protein
VSPRPRARSQIAAFKCSVAVLPAGCPVRRGAAVRRGAQVEQQGRRRSRRRRGETHSANGPRSSLSCAPFSLPSPPCAAVASARRAAPSLCGAFFSLRIHPPPSSRPRCLFVRLEARMHEASTTREGGGEWVMAVQCAVCGCASHVQAGMAEVGKTAADDAAVAVLPAVGCLQSQHRYPHPLNCIAQSAPTSALPHPLSAVTSAGRSSAPSLTARHPPCLSHAPMRKDTNDWKTHGRVCHSHWQGN